MSSRAVPENEQVGQQLVEEEEEHHLANRARLGNSGRRLPDHVHRLAQHNKQLARREEEQAEPNDSSADAVLVQRKDRPDHHVVYCRRQIAYDQVADIEKGMRFRADQRPDNAQDHEKQRKEGKQSIVGEGGGHAGAVVAVPLQAGLDQQLDRPRGQHLGAEVGPVGSPCARLSPRLVAMRVIRHFDIAIDPNRRCMKSGRSTLTHRPEADVYQALCENEDKVAAYRSMSTRKRPSALSLERSMTSNTPSPKPDPVTYTRLANPYTLRASPGVG